MKHTHSSTAGLPNRLFSLIGLAGSMLLAAGCVSTTPNLDSQFGKSVNLIKAQQTLNPEASRNTNPVAGIDGAAGKSGYDEYQKSYRAPTLLTPLNIGTSR